jgi:hypothetical protein
MQYLSPVTHGLLCSDEAATLARTGIQVGKSDCLTEGHFEFAWDIYRSHNKRHISHLVGATTSL